MTSFDTTRVLDDPLEITMYLSTVERFETELNLFQDGKGDLGKMPYYVRNVNMFTQDIALSPSRDNDLVGLDPNLSVKIQNLRENISFDGEIIHTHGRKLVILRIPSAIDFTNTRDVERFAPGPKNSSGISLQRIEDLSYKDIGIQGAYLMDFSERGVALRVMDSRCPQVGPGDRIQIHLHPDYAYLNKVNGIVAYKKYVEKRSDHPAFSKIGIRLDKALPLEKAQKVYSR